MHEIPVWILIVGIHFLFDKSLDGMNFKIILAAIVFITRLLKFHIIMLGPWY